MIRAWPVLLAFVAAAPSWAGDPPGKALFEQTCFACHGNDGRGALAGVPDLTRSDGPMAKSDQELLNSILNGFQSPGSPMAMPPRGGNPALTPEQAEAILHYLRSLAR